MPSNRIETLLFGQGAGGSITKSSSPRSRSYYVHSNRGTMYMVAVRRLDVLGRASSGPVAAVAPRIRLVGRATVAAAYREWSCPHPPRVGSSWNWGNGSFFVIRIHPRDGRLFQAPYCGRPEATVNNSPIPNYRFGQHGTCPANHSQREATRHQTPDTRHQNTHRKAPKSSAHLDGPSRCNCINI